MRLRVDQSRVLLAALVLAVAAIAIVAGCQAGEGSVTLRVGDCFNNIIQTDNDGNQIDTFAVVDCAQAHDSEVYSVFDYPGAGSAFPGYEAIGGVRQTRCEADFAAYVGMSWEQSAYLIGYASPTEETWATGDRAIHCLVEDAGGLQLSGSARGTAR